MPTPAGSASRRPGRSSLRPRPRHPRNRSLPRPAPTPPPGTSPNHGSRSEERRVGKECRSGGAPHRKKEKEAGRKEVRTLYKDNNEDGVTEREKGWNEKR